MSYAVEMHVGRSARIITGFATEDDAKGWAARANLQEIQGSSSITEPRPGSARPSKPQ